MKKKRLTKAMTFTMTEDVIAKLHALSEINSSSMSYEMRRLINEEYRRKKEEIEDIHSFEIEANEDDNRRDNTKN